MTTPDGHWSTPWTRRLCRPARHERREGAPGPDEEPGASCAVEILFAQAKHPPKLPSSAKQNIIPTENHPDLNTDFSNFHPTNIPQYHISTDLYIVHDMYMPTIDVILPSHRGRTGGTSCPCFRWTRPSKPCPTGASLREAREVSPQDLEVLEAARKRGTLDLE